jgi:hypothetical protein
VQLLPDPPPGSRVRRSRQKPRFLPAAYEVMSAEIVATISAHEQGAIAQLGERLVCNQEVAGSIPAGSTSSCLPPKKRRVMTRAHANQHQTVRNMCWRDRAIRRVVKRRCQQAQRLLFNNLESFCFDAKFSSESDLICFVSQAWKCRVRNVNQLEM